MQNKKISPFLIVIPLVVLAACSSLKLPGASQGAPQNAQTPGAFDPRNVPVEMRMAMGTLMLEKTDLAVTPAEAKDLLPLWKAVKSLSTSQTASVQEIDALYTQIKETMTPDQVKSIENMDLTQADFQKTMKDLGIQFPQGGPGGGDPNLTKEQRATRIAQFQAQNPGGGRGGQGSGSGGEFFFGPGGNPGFGPVPGDGAVPGQNNARQTPAAGRTGRRFNGMNMLFVDPLIKLLETRAGS